MDGPKALSKRGIIALLIAMLFGRGSPMSGQAGAKPNVQVNYVRAWRMVGVEVSILAGDQDLIVPYCGGGGPGEAALESLCGPPTPTRLEVQTAKGWRPVGLRYDAVLGALSRDVWEARQIPARKGHVFKFHFSKDDFAVKSGQRLRLVIDAWPDEQSMRSGGRPIQLTTTPFWCP
jgi:hypothetical protein